MLSDIGLEVNPSEISNVSCDNFQSVMLAIESALPGVSVYECEDLGILRAPIDINCGRTAVPKAVERLSAMSSRLESNDAHPAFFLLRNCLSMPRLLFKLRSSPCYRLHSELKKFDKTFRQSASTVCNVKFDDTGYQHYPSHMVVLASPLQKMYNCEPMHPSSVPLDNLSVKLSKTFLNPARHLYLTQSLNIGLHWDTNDLRWTRSNSNGIGHQLSTRLYSVPSNPTLRRFV